MLSSFALPLQKKNLFVTLGVFARVDTTNSGRTVTTATAVFWAKSKDAVSFEPFGIEVDCVADPHSAVSKKKHEAPNTPTILDTMTWHFLLVPFGCFKNS
jgi:hypothetical protein